MGVKLSLTKSIKTPGVLLFFLIAVIEIIHIQLLFGDGHLLAGGDNYQYLQLCKETTNNYSWKESLPFGGPGYDVANLFGIPLYSKLTCFLSQDISERLLIFTLYFLKYFGFFLLSKALFKRFLLFACIPACLLLVFNPFGALNPFSYLYLLDGAYLPLSLYLFVRLLKSERVDYLTLSIIALSSVIFSSLNSNPALSMTIFIPQLIYLIFNLHRLSKIKLLNLFLYSMVLILCNLWWIVAQVQYYFSSVGILSNGNWSDFTNQGSLFQNLRFIGQWGWYEGHYLYNYYPFSQYYDSPLVVIATYLVVALTMGYGVVLALKKDRPALFALVFLLISLFLVGGSRPPFGILYRFLYDHISAFKVFREPFTKFGELYVLAFSLLFYRLLLGIRDWIKPYFRTNIFILFLFLVFIFGKPAILGEHVWDKWNGSMRTFRVSVPQYWDDFYKFQKKNLKDERILTVPKTYYGSAWNWPKGFSSADDVAVNFVSNGNTILGRPINTGSTSEKVVGNFYSDSNVNSNYFNFLGVKYILRENDLDWRYSGELTLSPSQLDDWIKKLNVIKVAEFGKFTPEYLETIVNDDPNVNLKNELYKELLNRPALEIYQVDGTEDSQKFYPIGNIYYVNGEIEDISELLSFTGALSSTGLFLEDIDFSSVKESFSPNQIYGVGKRDYLSRGHYLVTVPEKGSYNVFIKGDKIGLTGFKLTPSLDIVKGWYNIGNTSLEDSKEYSFFLDIPRGKNILAGTEPWHKSNLIGENNYADLAKTLFLEEGGDIYYKFVDSKELSGSYSISLDYNFSKDILGFAVVGVQQDGGYKIFSEKFSGAGAYYNEMELKKDTNSLLFLKQEFLINDKLKSKVDFMNISFAKAGSPSVVLKKVSDEKQQKTRPPNITYTKINPTKYRVQVDESGDSYNLVFNESFDKNWKLYFKGRNEISSTRHFKINGYANLWKIEPEDVGDASSYTLTVEYVVQRKIDLLIGICLTTFFSSLTYVIIRGVIKLKEYLVFNKVCLPRKKYP
ncbi:alpha-(1-_3)-arabinofuranosyltransferase family protein [Candidatus Parcubacteria bacterium]|nr:DUF3367 domain-containing protein [Patescibacteria group bacterium]MCG2689506.1 alpha-(1->3)-arabinofuranosyltransferase family protein [Candidatus Parcubacteria bacterium]